jgi:CheY-like chemotaxis protein
MATILYVSDERRRTAITNLLQGRGHNVDIARNIAEAKQAVASGSYDLLLVARVGNAGEDVRFAEEQARASHRVRLITSEDCQSSEVVCLDEHSCRTDSGYLTRHIEQALRSPVMVAK